MKKIILLFINLLLNIFLVIPQANNNSKMVDLSNKIKNKEYLNFLNKFYDVELPLNYKKEVIKIENGNIELKEMMEKEAIKYLSIRNDDLYYYEEIYNYDTDEKKVIKTKNLPVYQFRVVKDKYVLLCVRELGGLYGDTTLISLYTLGFDGKLIDNLNIKEQRTPESDWSSLYIPSIDIVNVYNYNINIENYEKTAHGMSLKNKDNSKTILKIEEFNIDPNGRFKKKKEYPILYLKEEILNYKTYSPNSDDPLSKL